MQKWNDFFDLYLSNTLTCSLLEYVGVMMYKIGKFSDFTFKNELQHALVCMGSLTMGVDWSFVVDANQSQYIVQYTLIAKPNSNAAFFIVLIGVKLSDVYLHSNLLIFVLIMIFLESR